MTPRSISNMSELICRALAIVSFFSSALALVVALISGPWEGCGELPASSSEVIAVGAAISTILAMILYAIVALTGGVLLRQSFRFQILMLGAAIMFAGALVAMRHHSYGPGCG